MTQLEQENQKLLVQLETQAKLQEEWKNKVEKELKSTIEKQNQEIANFKKLGAPILWSGGSTTTGSASGWNKYKTDATEFNTAQEHFAVAADGTFVVLKSGYYRINFFCISLGSSTPHIEIVHNGNRIHCGYEAGSGGAWSDNFVDLTWRFKKMDTFYINVYNPGTHAYHSWNARGEYSRLQVQFVGDWE
jgi:hypothetical protein